MNKENCALKLVDEIILLENVVRLIIFVVGYTSPIFGMRSRNHAYYRDAFE